MQAIALLVVLVASLTSGQETDSNTTAIIQTTNGPIIGLIDASTSTQVFKNIPFGANTASTRFKAPIPPPRWTEPRICTEYGNVAPQPWGMNVAGRIQSENCLNLNLWTPALDGKKRPVLVYFHGGGYADGTANDPLYDGIKLSVKHDVVVVTVNHRLNGFGYLYLGGLSDDFREAGNAGQMDLVLALKWIRDNIANFGGDGNSVTIFGQSGGGAKCATLMAMPAAKGLFHRVWTMSGQQITGRTKDHAEQTAKTLLMKASGAPGNLSSLFSMSVEDLRKAMSGNGQQWTPVVDGYTLPENPYYPTANILSKDIPMVMGNTYDETRNLIGSAKPALFNLSWPDVPKVLDQNIKAFIGNLSTDNIITQYREHYPNYTPSDVFFAASTAARSWKSMLVQAEIRARQTSSPLWTYYLRWKSPFEGGKWGAAHTFDIPFVFANPSAMKQTKGANGAEAMADTMSRMLVQFARTGDPSIPDIESIPSVPEWPRYQLQDRKSMIFDIPLEVHADDRGWEREFWKDVPYIQPGT